MTPEVAVLRELQRVLRAQAARASVTITNRPDGRVVLCIEHDFGLKEPCTVVWAGIEEKALLLAGRLKWNLKGRYKPEGVEVGEWELNKPQFSFKRVANKLMAAYEKSVNEWERVENAERKLKR